MKKGFTLIELLAVIIILAVVAVIATPIVLDVVDDAKESANRSYIAEYANRIELAVAQDFFYDQEYPIITDEWFNNHDVNIEGVVCEESYYDTIIGVVLNRCTVSKKNDVALLNNVVHADSVYCYARKKVYSDCSDLDYTSHYNHAVINKTNRNDKTKPTIDLQVDDSIFNDKGWAKNDFSVVVNTNDEGGSLIYGYKWCVDTKPCKLDNFSETNTGEILVNVESSTTNVCVQSIDNGGNNSSVVCNEYKLDKTAPIINGLTGINVYVGNTIDLISGVEANDSLSGLNGTYSYTPTTISNLTLGTYEVTYKAIDDASNETSVVRNVNIIDNHVYTWSTRTKTVNSCASTVKKCPSGSYLSGSYCIGNTQYKSMFECKQAGCTSGSYDSKTVYDGSAYHTYYRCKSSPTSQCVSATTYGDWTDYSTTVGTGASDVCQKKSCEVDKATGEIIDSTCSIGNCQ